MRELTSFSFVTSAGPANVSLVMGPNGSGKTSVLEAIRAAVALLGSREHGRFGLDAVDDGDGAFQLDVRTRIVVDGRARTSVLSIATGTSPLHVYGPEQLDAAEADEQVTLLFVRQRAGRIIAAPFSTATGLDVVDAIAAATGQPVSTLYGRDSDLPTVLYFPTLRGTAKLQDGPRAITMPPDLVYRPSHRFGMTGGDWDTSLENLLVWLSWLDDGRIDQCRELVNELVFAGRTKRLGHVDRADLRMRVETDGGSHRLDQLSHGERQLLEFVLRVATHMTRSTIVLLDEAELHLHLVFRRRLMVLLKRWAAEHEGLTFLLTSHQLDMLRIFRPKDEEAGLRKHGFVMRLRRPATR